MSGVVGLLLVVVAVFLYMRRQKRPPCTSTRSSRPPRGTDISTRPVARHWFDAAKFHATELTPRAGGAAGAGSDIKQQPYKRMSDELNAGGDRKEHLEVPLPSYAVSRNGLRARSPSPDPDRKPAL